MEITHITAQKEFARFILMNSDKYEWSLQGMGMLRLYLNENVRLHIWNSKFRAPGVSMIHDHIQWGLTSHIIAGELINKKYEMTLTKEPTHQCGMLKPGYGCYFKKEPMAVNLTPKPPELLVPGQSYFQYPMEIHETDALDGTVTLMIKEPTGDESARVFWPIDKKWGSAEPRKATAREVHEIVSHSLKTWF